MKTWVQLAQEQSKIFSLSQPLSVGETYTISMNSNEPFIISVGDVFVGETVDGSLEFIATNSGDVMITSYSDISMEFEIKLELGSQTEWSPAPEDGYGYTGDDGAMHLTTIRGFDVVKVRNIVSSFGNMSFESGIKIKNFGDSRVTSFLDRSDQSGAYVASNEYKEIVVSGRVKEAAPYNNIIWQLISANVSEGLDLIVSDPYINLAEPSNKFKSVDVYICRGISNSINDTLSLSYPVNSVVNLYCPPAELFEGVPVNAPLNMVRNSIDGFDLDNTVGVSDPFGMGMMFNEFAWASPDSLSRSFTIEETVLPPVPEDSSKDKLIINFTLLNVHDYPIRGYMAITAEVTQVNPDGSEDFRQYDLDFDFNFIEESKDFTFRIRLNRPKNLPSGTRFYVSSLYMQLGIGESIAHYPLFLGKVSIKYSPDGVADNMWYPRLDDHFTDATTSEYAVSVYSPLPTRNFKVDLNFSKVPQSMEEEFICDILNLSEHPIVLSTEGTAIPGTGERVDVVQGSGFSETRIKGAFSSTSPSRVILQNKNDLETPATMAGVIVKIPCKRELTVATWVLTKT